MERRKLLRDREKMLATYRVAVITGYGPSYGINLKSQRFLNKTEDLRLPEQDASAVKQSLCAKPRKGHQFCAIISTAKLVATNIVEQLTLLQGT